MKITRNFLTGFFIVVILLVCISCSSSSSNNGEPLNLRIIHMNDSHSYLDPVKDVSMTFDGEAVKTSLGGMSRMKSAVDYFRETSRNCLTLHAGDAVQGTYYFTFFNGIPDFEVLNDIELDAMTFGNHEFDRGPELLNTLIGLADFPMISANIDFSNEPEITLPISRYIIKTFKNVRVGIIGVTTTETAHSSSPGPNIIFNDVLESVDQTVDELENLSINKIIVLSHNGYENDKELAASVSGIDVIVGGHSHTLLGDPDEFAEFGISVEKGYEYPTIVSSPEGKDVLIVQAWRFGEAIGLLDVDFDKYGDITSYSGHPTIINTSTFTQGGTPVPDDLYNKILQLIADTDILHIFTENAGTEEIIQPYRDRSEEEINKVIAEALDDIYWYNDVNKGPGPVVADSMLWKTQTGMNVNLSIENRGAIRVQIPQGSITYGKVIEVLPFNSTLIVMELKGTDVKNALEDNAEYIINKYDMPYFAFVSGIKYTVQYNEEKGSRIIDMKFKNTDGDYVDFDMNADYRIVVNAFLAAGGDGFTTLKNSTGYRYDTGFVDFEVFGGYLSHLGSISNPTEQRITVNY